MLETMNHDVFNVNFTLYSIIRMNHLAGVGLYEDLSIYEHEANFQ